MLEAEQEKSQKNQNAAVSETWQAKFDLFDQAGGTSPRYINQLEWRERVALTYNAPALFLGILYFLWKGMWRKGLGLLGFCLAVGVVICPLKSPPKKSCRSVGSRSMPGHHS